MIPQFFRPPDDLPSRPVGDAIPDRRPPAAAHAAADHPLKGHFLHGAAARGLPGRS
jgi:hypothetical protein